MLRASGTEPVIRVMVEGYDAVLVKKGAREIAASGWKALRRDGACSYEAAQLIFGAFPAKPMPEGVRMRRPVVAGNWKMHGSRSANQALLTELERRWKPSGPSMWWCFRRSCTWRRGADPRGRSNLAGGAGCVRRGERGIHRSGECGHAERCGLPST